MNTNSELPRAEGLFERIIQFSIQHAIWVMLFACIWIAVEFTVIKSYLLMQYQILRTPKYRLIPRQMGLLHLK